MSRLPQLLVVNPNTSLEVQATIDTFARAVVGDAALITTVSAGYGFSYLQTRVSTVIAAHAALDAAAAAVATAGAPDAVVLACFGDPGLDALEELVARPVAGFAEAGIMASAALPGRFIIAVNGTSWCRMLEELVRKLGVDDRVAAIVSIENCGPAPASIAEFIAEAARQHHAERAVLGGAGLIETLPAIIAAAKIPILDPHREAFRKALRLATTTSLAPRQIETTNIRVTGLSPALGWLLKG